MKVPKSVLGKMALGIGGLTAITGTGAVVVVTSDTPGTGLPSTKEPNAVVQVLDEVSDYASDAFHSVFGYPSFPGGGCPACGMG